MVGIQVSAGAGSFGSGPYPDGSWANSTLGNNKVDAIRAMAAFNELDIPTPHGMVNGNAG